MNVSALQEMTSQIAYKIVGGKPIHGKIACMGAKNFATKAMVASLLSARPTVLHNVPHIGDVEITQYLLESAGAKITWDQDVMSIDTTAVRESTVALPDSRTNRIPILLVSVLLHKFGRAEVPTVGGDDIGKRNLDFHVQALESFGAKVYSQENKYIAEVQGRLKSCHVHLPYPSVGATETCLFLSVLAEGTSVISNIAIEPEIMALITMLRSMGAVIFMNSNREITVHGVSELSGSNTYILGDRIEAASWACLACASNGEIEVSGIRPDLLGNFLSHYTQIGGGYRIVDREIISFYRKEKLRSTIIETDVAPGFSTDWQQPFSVLLTQAEGMSVIHETVYEQRFGYLEVLAKLGANAQTTNVCLGSLPCRYKGRDYKHSALIYGPTILQACAEAITVPDIRAGLAYLIAAVLADGETTLLAAEQIERGYGNLLKRLQNVNLNITRLVLESM
jgi:UDP-N-acetylglucosamine 1-carboxyvinyltransferase